MARSFSAVKSARGKEIHCGRCQAKIEPGQKYFYFSVGFRGQKQIRCEKHPPRQSELCSSKLSGAYAAIEGVEDDIAALRAGKQTVADLVTSLNSAADEIEGVRDEYQESFDNLPENFQQADQGQQIEEKVEGLDSFADTLRQAAEEIESMGSDSGEGDSEATDDSAEEDNENDDAADKAEEALGEFSL